MKKSLLIIAIALLSSMGTFAQDSNNTTQATKPAKSDTQTVISIDDVIEIKGKVIDQLADFLTDIVDIVNEIDQAELEKTAVKLSGDLEKIVIDITEDPEIKKVIKRIEEKVDTYDQNEVEVIEVVPADQ